MAVYISGFQTGTWVNGSNSYVLSSSAIQSSAAGVYSLAANSGSFTLTGNSADLSVGLPANSGSFALTGYAASEAIGEPAGSGTFALSGRVAALATQLPLTSGVFSLTGNAATITYSGAGNKSLAALSGTFSRNRALGIDRGWRFRLGWNLYAHRRLCPFGIWLSATCWIRDFSGYRQRGC
jgi:hypothetical protein